MSATETKVVQREHDSARGTFGSYLLGFILSIFFTIYAYIAATGHKFSSRPMTAFLLGLGVLQFVVQLWFFLHIGRETKPRWKRLTLVLMMFFVVVVVLGSIWIMYNLNYRMSPQQINQYMNNQAGEGF